MFPSVYPSVPRFGPAFWLVVLAATVYIAVAALRSRAAYRRLVSTRETDPAALVRFYRRNIARKCWWLLPVAVVLSLSGGPRPAQLGLAWPHGRYVGDASAIFGYLVVMVLVSGLMWRWWARTGRSVLGQRAFWALVPRTRHERRWAAAVALSAGVCEELLVRGLLLSAALSAGLSLTAAVLATSVLFGLLHLYQGWFGMLGTSAVGLLLAGLLVVTGSLLFPVAAHILIDVRALLMVPAPGAGRSPAPHPARSEPAEARPRAAVSATGVPVLRRSTPPEPAR